MTRILADRRSEVDSHASKTPLSKCDSGEVSREKEVVPPNAVQPHAKNETPQESTGSQDVLFASHGTLAVVDLGASQTVMGCQQKEEFLKNLPPEISSRTYETPVSMSFRFGNNSTVQCEMALMVPIGPVWIRIAIVPSKTPFLLSNNVFCQLGAIIDTNKQSVYFERINCSVPLELSPRKLFMIDVCALANIAQGTKFIKKGSRREETHQPVLHSTVVERHETPNDHQKEGQEEKCSCNAMTSSSTDNHAEIHQHSISEDRERVPTVRSQSSVSASTSNAFKPCQSIRSSEEGGASRSNRTGPVQHEFRPDPTHEDSIRRDQTGAGISSCGSHGSQVLQLVPEDVGRFNKASSQGVHLFSQPLHGAHGDDARAHQPEQSSIKCPKGQIQGQGQESGVCAPDPRRCPGDLAGRAESGDLRSRTRLGSSVNGEPSRERRDGQHQGEVGTDGDCDAASGLCSSTTASESKGSPVDQHATNMCEYEVMFGKREPPKINWVAKEMWEYMQKKGFLNQSKENLGRSRSDVLEVYCSSESELTK